MNNLKSAFFCCLVFGTQLLFAAGEKTVYSRINNASWTNNSHWSSTSGGPSCTCTPDETKDLIYIETNTSSAAGINFGSQVTLVVTNTTTLTINGDVTFANGAIIQVDAGSAIVINGNLTNNNNSNQVSINGTLSVNGNFTGGNGSTIVGTGSMNTTGSTSTSGTGMVFGSSGSCSPGPCVTSTSSPLPVELLSFKATSDGENVVISWETSSEFNNDYFTIERSQDGMTFQEAGNLKGTGNSHSITAYSLTDNAPIKGLSYYRLKQTDFDGTSKIYGPVSVWHSSGEEISMTVLPNVASSLADMAIRIDGKKGTAVQLTLRDVTGRDCLSRNLVLENESQTFHISPENQLPQGAYFLIATGNGLYSTSKVMLDF